MTKTICLDFGNTRLKLGLFENDELKEIFVLADAYEDLKSIIEQHSPQRSILSSVIKHDEKIEQLLKETTRFHKLSHQSKLPFAIPVGKPETMGTDRMAIAAASVFLFPAERRCRRNFHTLFGRLGSISCRDTG